MATNAEVSSTLSSELINTTSEFLKEVVDSIESFPNTFNSKVFINSQIIITKRVFRYFDIIIQ